jgi:hypothetical protein
MPPVPQDTPQDAAIACLTMAGVNALDAAILRQLARAVQLLEDTTLRQLAQLGELGDVAAGLSQLAHDPALPKALSERVEQHIVQLEGHIGGLLDGLHCQDVIKQIVDRIEPSVQARQSVLADLARQMQDGSVDTRDMARRAQALATNYLEAESAHHDQTPETLSQPGLPDTSIQWL